MGKNLYTIEHMELVAKLKQARTELRLTQVEVAQILKKPQSYVSKIERGERRVDVPELVQLANVYGKKITFFIKKITT